MATNRAKISSYLKHDAQLLPKIKLPIVMVYLYQVSVLLDVLGKFLEQD
jgi:hypothetical protein